MESIGRYITVDSSNIAQTAWGTRHNSVAAITSVTKCVGIVISQSGSGILTYKDGMLIKRFVGQ